MSFKDKFVQECILFMRREDIKTELKNFMRPIIGLILKDIYPYIYLSMLFVIISFLLILGIFIILIRNNKII